MDYKEKNDYNVITTGTVTDRRIWDPKKGECTSKHQTCLCQVKLQLENQQSHILSNDTTCVIGNMSLCHTSNMQEAKVPVVLREQSQFSRDLESRTKPDILSMVLEDR